MSSNDIGSKFAANMGVKAPFYKALKEWNDSNKLKSWCVPARGTKEHEAVMEIMREKYLSSSSKKSSKDKKNEKTIQPSPEKPKNTKQPAVQDTSNIIEGKRERKKPTNYNPRIGRGMKNKK